MGAGPIPLTDEQLLALRLRRVLATKQRRRRRREEKVPEQRFPKGAETQYFADLRAKQKEVEQAVREILYPEINQVPTASSEFITRKVGEVRFAVGATISENALENLAMKAGQQLNLFNRGQVGKQLKKVIGVDVLMAEPWLGEHLATFRRENVNLVKSLFGNQLDDLENLLLRANRSGLQVDEIRKQIQEKFGLSRKRARLIARDQVNKLNGELTQLRQTSLGVTEYIWRMSKDERVRGNPTGRYPSARPSHWAREGKKYKWSEPPSGGHPGEAVLCRCRAEPVLAPLIEGAEDLPE